MIAQNAGSATHYLPRIEGARPADRWVAVDCGRLSGAGAVGDLDPDSEPSLGSVAKARPREGQLVLAASWQPAFCERRARVPECRGQTPGRPDARQFSLHGLWPQPIGKVYCGVGQPERALSESGHWGRLPRLSLAPELRDSLAERMPGVLSHLDRHQWSKHGTCYGTDPNTYFSQALVLLDQLNRSSVRLLFESSIGGRLRATQVRQVFDQYFGPGAGERVRLVCDEAGLITELRIGLKGPVGDDASLGALIIAAPARGVGCRGGWVDRVGKGR